ncbi:unnamed protein product [Microthlaspi erraticum]|uniref:Uncharacterized protein n=1 Tax=Microthlaspi erraticum TaxID=1685480 RepID=A0A6D2IIL3_9BRAS|nr:unnamed protein product [Microthlaspi erraticum]
MKLLFPKELIDENLEGFKEKVTRTLKLFPKAVVPRDIHGEIVYPAVNHPPDTHCKEKRLGGSKMPLDRRRKRCENTIRAKHWPRTRKEILAEQFQSGRPYGRAGKEKPCSAGLLHRATETVRAARTNRRRKAAIGHVSERTDRAGRSGKQTRPRPKSLAKQIWPTKSLDRDKIHRPSAQNFSRPRYTMAKTKGNESMKKKKNPFMQPPKKQIKLGSSSSNARAAIPTSPHSIDAIKNMWRVQEEEKMIGHL